MHNKVCTQRRKTKKDKLIPENRMFFYFQTGMKSLKRILVCQRVTKVILRELRVINYRRRIIYIRAHTHTIMCTQILAMTEETLRMVILERLQTIRTPELNETNRWSEIKSFTKCIKKFPTSFSNCTWQCVGTSSHGGTLAVLPRCRLVLLSPNKHPGRRTVVQTDWSGAGAQDVVLVVRFWTR